MKNILVISSLVIFANLANAGNYTDWTVPTRVELVSNGVLVHGEFGDPNSCGKPNYIFVSKTNPSYESALSIFLAAFMATKELRIYSGNCTNVNFHWAGEVINENNYGQPVYIR
jgi:hypothetical protein